eukprot:770122-Pleurochrysis_carterae.AAC.3
MSSRVKRCCSVSTGSTIVVNHSCSSSGTNRVRSVVATSPPQARSAEKKRRETARRSRAQRSATAPFDAFEPDVCVTPRVAYMRSRTCPPSRSISETAPFGWLSSLTCTSVFWVCSVSHVRRAQQRSSGGRTRRIVAAISTVSAECKSDIDRSCSTPVAAGELCRLVDAANGIVELLIRGRKSTGDFPLSNLNLRSISGRKRTNVDDLLTRRVTSKKRIQRGAVVESSLLGAARQRGIDGGVDHA